MEVWSDEIIVSYETNLVMANLVMKMNHKGRKGDTIHIPAPIRGAANAKVAKQQVTLQFATEDEVPVLIDQHFEYSRLIEDIVGVQALDSLRRFYTKDAGYALARQKDTDLIQLGRFLNAGAGTDAYAEAFEAGDGVTPYAAGPGTDITDLGMRCLIQKLDDNDVPQMDRHIVIPPSGRKTMMGLPRFTEEAFVGERGSNNTIRNGKIGDVYGIDVYVTPQADTAAGGARIGLIFHEDSMVCVDQMGVRTQTQYKQEYLGDLLTADHLYGVKVLRPGNVEVPASGLAFAMPV